MQLEKSNTFVLTTAVPTGYQIFRSTSSNSGFTKIADVSRTYYRDTNLTRKGRNQ